MLDFEALRSGRKAIKEFSVRHYASVAAFRPDNLPSFDVEEPALLEISGDDGGAHHRTTVATCLESLRDEGSDEACSLIREVAPVFVTRALREPFNEWKSDGAAFVYSRVRTLPALVEFAPEQAKAEANALKEHLEFVWADVSVEPPNQAVREATLRNGENPEELTIDNARELLERTYPANAFHTYWALKTLEACSHLPETREVTAKFEQKREIALLWTQNMLSAQVAMHAARSDQADANQLAWALTSQLVDGRTGARLATGELSRAPLYEAALAAFFDQQLPTGKWPLGQPLFHYPTAGNAYCYTFETLAELLLPALRETAVGKLLRELLKPHVGSIFAAWEFARSTARPLRTGGAAVGWASGHHPHRTDPEGWATASVFAFIQRFRHLLGAYTREVAAADLGVRPTKFGTREAGTRVLVERGDTWTGGRYWSAGEQIAALFLHPLHAGVAAGETIDPDEPLIQNNQARSAILFGPPGTSKTTIVEALAAAVEWDIVEIHASRFLAEGMDRVPSSADWIFLRLMELDRCVVLFDEIDELLRDRQDEDADPFGRFLTTSMLPKVATLWQQGRIIFFVATNDIAGADPAIKRSQRFDSAIFVAPPSFHAKLEKLAGLLPGADLSCITEHKVEEALEKGSSLGFFALLRNDQIDELGDLVRGREITAASIEEALAEMGEGLKRRDWQRRPRGNSADDLSPLDMFKEMRKNETRDHRMIRLICVEGEPVEPLPDDLSLFRSRKGVKYLQLMRSGDRPPNEIRTKEGSLTPDPILRYRS
jgi:ATPase family associated with various cellular activities (AAA)